MEDKCKTGRVTIPTDLDVVRVLLGLPTGLLRPHILDSTHATYDGHASLGAWR